MTNRTVLSLQDVTVRYGPSVVVDSLNLEVDRGEVLGLLGPNGSGKSSTLAAIAGSVPLAGGRILIMGVREAGQPLRYRRLLGLVPQELAFYEDLSTQDNLLFFGRLYGLRGRELRLRVAREIEAVHLTEHARSPARTLSGGMSRRLNLACALLHEPPLLLLDEPTSGLDHSARAALFTRLRALRARGCALVYTTHHPEEVEALCDRLALLDRGHLVAEGTPEELSGASVWGYTDPPQPSMRNLLPGPERLRGELTGRSLDAA